MIPSGRTAAFMIVDGFMMNCERHGSSRYVSQLSTRSYSSSNRRRMLSPTFSRGVGRISTAATQYAPSHSRLYSSTTILPTSTKSSSSPSSASTTMKDEYGEMTSEGETYQYPGDFVLENGQVLVQPQLRYMTYGELNERRDNVLVICHALTGNASLHGWWGGLLGPQRAFDTSQYYILCCNILGSCYGSTNPTSINPTTQRAFGKDFPDVSVQDTVRLQLMLLQDHLKVHSVESVIGGSFGGMQAIEFAVQGGSSQAPFTTSQGMLRNIFWTRDKGSVGSMFDFEWFSHFTEYCCFGPWYRNSICTFCHSYCLWCQTYRMANCHFGSATASYLCRSDVGFRHTAIGTRWLISGATNGYD
jgi:hypothetical protein